MKLGSLVSSSLLILAATQAQAASYEWRCSGQVVDPQGYNHYADSDYFLDSRGEDQQTEVEADFAQFLMRTYPVNGAVDTSGRKTSWEYNPRGLWCEYGHKPFDKQQRIQLIQTYDKNPELKFVTFVSPHPPTNTKLASNATQGTAKASSATNTSSGNPAGDGFAYRPNLNKCIHFDRDPGSLYFENSCKASVTVSWYQLPRTNNSSWGTSDCGPASKCVVGINGVNYERSTDFHIAACPKGFDSVLMNGNQWTDNGPFRCRTMLKK